MRTGRISNWLIVAAAAMLTGCSDTLRMQAASVTRLDDGTEWVMTGETLVDLELSSMTRLSGSGLACEMPMVMRVDRAGAGRMTCRDETGTVVYAEDQVIPAGVYSTSVRGTFVDRIDTVQGTGQMALGWGSYADPDVLRTLLD